MIDRQAVIDVFGYNPENYQEGPVHPAYLRNLAPWKVNYPDPCEVCSAPTPAGRKHCVTCATVMPTEWSWWDDTLPDCPNCEDSTVRPMGHGRNGTNPPVTPWCSHCGWRG